MCKLWITIRKDFHLENWRSFRREGVNKRTKKTVFYRLIYWLVDCVREVFSSWANGTLIAWLEIVAFHFFSALFWFQSWTQISIIFGMGWTWFTVGPRAISSKLNITATNPQNLMLTILLIDNNFRDAEKNGFSSRERRSSKKLWAKSLYGPC